jgi:hypothetical protein
MAEAQSATAVVFDHHPPMARWCERIAREIALIEANRARHPD